MKDKITTPLALVLIATALAIGAYAYLQKPSAPVAESGGEETEALGSLLPQAVPSDLSGVTDTIESATAAIQNAFASSAEKCEQEVKSDILALKPRRIQVTFLESESFGSAASAMEFMLARGYTNPAGHATTDINATGETADLTVAVISLKSRLPSKEDENVPVTMELTQPIACVGGAIAQNSKTFLNTTLKNEPGVRSALYQIGRVVEETAL